ncbi:DNA ligase D [Olivibacter sitiensis]|uniref:DNA ligase D n=1 Tax=Olivibacter sitiensis TaxID=376470 RepID=UPI000482036F|nr:DNA ligase D [Olivibacter sitiensis]
MSLKSYQQKRNFSESPEPQAKKGEKEKVLHFVVQRHQASHLHYDFRLEMDGVLKSWAVPKGPSLNPHDKRLAMQVEDHPLDYRHFEGTIPEGNYGAGLVEIWDEGTYQLEGLEGTEKSGEAQLLKDLKKGSLKFVLHGKKLKGSFALVKMKSAKDENAWLLLKHNDQYAVQRSAFHRPMLAKETQRPFSGADWLFEIKWDGYRAIAETGKDLRLYSRNGLDLSARYTTLVDELRGIGENMVLDGEIVAFNEAGLPSFQLLQQWEENPEGPIYYYVFDLLELDGKSLEAIPLLERKQKLEKLLSTGKGYVLYCDHVFEKGEAFFKEVGKRKLEGMMAKRTDSLYHEGKRTSDWLKVKHQQQEEAIVVGYTAPQGARKYFGALALGMYEGEKLVYVGNVGTGFSDAVLEQLARTMEPLKVSKCPLDGEPPLGKKITWIRPQLVASISYAEITKDGRFRQPVYHGLREDKDAEEVRKGEAHVVENNSREMKKSFVDLSKGKEQTLTLNGHKVHVTNLDKIYWPKEGISKIDLLNYYQSVQGYILPYLKNRPQSLHRHPNGIDGSSFFHKDAGAEAPEWINTASLYSESADKDIDYILCNNRATLLYLNNLGCIELNPWNSKLSSLDKPDYLIIDIDPSPKNSFDDVIEVALKVKEVLGKAGTMGYCKTSGATGMHVYVPLHAKYSYEPVRQFAEIIAQLVHHELPTLTTMERSLSKRPKNAVYMDYLQNKRGQTLASVYSVRPREGATVSTPVRWEELKKGLRPTDFNIFNVPQRLENIGDVFKPVLGKGIDLNKSMQKLQSNE